MAQGIQGQQNGGKFRVPVKLIPEDRFAAFDFGTSVLKVVYIRKEDRAILKSANREDRVEVYVVSFSRDAFEDALDLVAVRSLPEDDSKNNLVFLATGLDASQALDSYNKKLGTRIMLPWELDCEIECVFKLINSLPKDEVVLPLCHTSWETGWELARAMGATFAQINMITVTVTSPRTVDKEAGKQALVPLPKPRMLYREADENLFPFFCVMAGSTNAIMEVASDGSSLLLYRNILAGRSLLGLGSLLTGAKSYDELMSLAEKGDNSKLDIMMSDGFEGNDSDAYSGFKKSGKNVRGHWGKCFQTGIENWKKEDLARTVVCMIANETANWIVSTAVGRGVKRALMFGSMPNHPLMRSELTTSFAGEHTWHPDHVVEVEFITNGSHMGALGALMCDPHVKIQEVAAPMSR